MYALTSLVLSDAFTGRTGVEEAFSCLLEPGAWSCALLSSDVLAILNMVAKSTPVRTFYPDHLKCMPKVEWDTNLNPLIQHTQFYELATAIIRFNIKFIGLYVSPAPPSLESSWGSEFLQVRGCTATLRLLRAWGA